MADLNLTQLTETTTPTGDALVYIVDDPAGTPADRTISLTTLLSSAGGRELLTANRTYYVRTDGSDSNSGLANTAGGAFLTIQRAVTVVAYSLNLGGYDVTISVADGTYSESVTISNAWDGKGTVSIVGNSTTPTNVIVPGRFSATGHSRITVRDLQCMGLVTSSYGYLSFTNLVFVTGSNNMIEATDNGMIESTGNWKIAGGPYVYGLYANSGGTIYIPNTVTLTGTPDFSGSFVYAAQNSRVISTVNYSGSATGVRYLLTENSSLMFSGASPSVTTLPGDELGTRQAGSYVEMDNVNNGTIQSANQSVTSSTTLTNSSYLLVQVEAARAYKFTAKLYTTSNVAGGVKAAIAGTCTATTIVYEGFNYSGGTVVQTRATALGAEVGAVTAVTAAYIEIKGSILTNAGGTLRVQFAQNVSNAGATTVLALSSFEVSPAGE